MASGKEGLSLGYAARCAVCGDECEERPVTIALPSASSGFALIRNVPAEVCQSCGETRFSLRTAQLMVAAVRNTQPPAEVVAVPIYDLARFAEAGAR